MAHFLPADAMGLVRRVVADVISPNKGTFLSLGILGTLWAASGGFAAMIEALDIAYAVRDDRPFWKTRPLAVGLAFLTGTLMLIALSVMVVGPRFGEWLAGKVQLFQILRAAVALHSLDYRRRVHNPCDRGDLFSLTQRQTALPGNATRRGGRRRLLDRLVVFAGTLLSPLRKLQQNLRNTGSGYCTDGLAVLDGLCHTGGSGTE